MIKTLLDADENPPPDTAVIIEKTVLQPTGEMSEITGETVNAPIFVGSDAADGDDILEIPKVQTDAAVESPGAPIIADVPSFASGAAATDAVASTNEIRPESILFAAPNETVQPETTAETVRKSGLAYAAAVILFGSIIFMLILGWFADLIFGSSPWGVVAGIILGSIIGFVQFFRTTSQILKK